MSWQMIVLVGFVGAQPTGHPIPMQNRDACVTAATQIRDNSVAYGFLCINSETGEVVTVPARRPK